MYLLKLNNVLQLFKQRENVNLEPPYQRLSVWDKEKQQEYITELIDGLVITCETCEERIPCDKRYEDCQYNPANEVD